MTTLIAHRGNTAGAIPAMENNPHYILQAIDLGFDVEIDVRVSDDKIFLGHDEPQYPIDLHFILTQKEHLWLHCKNLEALRLFGNTDYRAFFHNSDDFTLTSNCKIWTYPGKPLTPHSIVVLQQDTLAKYTDDQLRQCYGICSDDVQALKRILGI